jgi:hypothetical protein
MWRSITDGAHARAQWVAGCLTLLRVLEYDGLRDGLPAGSNYTLY